MIQFELHTPSVDPGVVQWRLAASISVDDHGRHELFDPEHLIDLDAVHGTPRSPEDGVRFRDAPQEWARAALATFNAPDLVPANVIDTDPWPQAEFDALPLDFTEVRHGHVAPLPRVSDERFVVL